MTDEVNAGFASTVDETMISQSTQAEVESQKENRVMEVEEEKISPNK